jgi:hypothetical protein
LTVACIVSWTQLGTILDGLIGGASEPTISIRNWIAVLIDLRVCLTDLIVFVFLICFVFVFDLIACLIGVFFARFLCFFTGSFVTNNQICQKTIKSVSNK